MSSALRATRETTYVETMPIQITGNWIKIKSLLRVTLYDHPTVNHLVKGQHDHLEGWLIHHALPKKHELRPPPSCQRAPSCQRSSWGSEWPHWRGSQGQTSEEAHSLDHFPAIKQNCEVGGIIYHWYIQYLLFVEFIITEGSSKTLLIAWPSMC